MITDLIDRQWRIPPAVELHRYEILFEGNLQRLQERLKEQSERSDRQPEE